VAAAMTIAEVAAVAASPLYTLSPVDEKRN